MSVELTFTSDPAWFLEHARPALAADPVLATVVSTFTRVLARADAPPPGPGVARWWVLVHEDGELAGAAMRTMPVAPYAPFLLPMSESAALILARSLHGRGEVLRAVNGALPAAAVVTRECAGLQGGAPPGWRGTTASTCSPPCPHRRRCPASSGWFARTR